MNNNRKVILYIAASLDGYIAKPNDDLKPHAPRAHTIIIERELIGAVIGPGGKVVQEIQRESGATVNIEEKDNKGYISIFATNGDSMNAARKRIEGIVKMPEVGEVYEGKVKNIMEEVSLRVSGIRIPVKDRRQNPS